jgi:hypothetical protein
MKYIMLQNAEGHKLPVVFSEKLVHAHVAKYIADLSRVSLNARYEVVNAGFVSFTPDGVATHGDSESLDLKANPLDGLRMWLGEAVSHMPDEVLPGLYQKYQERMKNV